MDLTIPTWMRSRALAVAASAVLIGPMIAGCGSGNKTAYNGGPGAPVDDTLNQRAQTYAPPAQQRHGLSTGQKLAVLGGAAALYYLYKKNKQARAQGQANVPQYYLSKNGRVYYRDASGTAHWVTPPQGGIQVPEQEAESYRDFQGYNGRSSGRTLLDLADNGGY